MFHFGVAEDGFTEFRIEQSGHRVFHLVDQLVNDAVKFDLHAFAFRGRDRHVFNFSVKADHDGVGRARQQNIRLRNWADAGVNHFEINFLAFDLLQRSGQRFNRTLGIAFQNETENFYAAG